MMRISIVGNACGAILMFAGFCLAADTRRPASSPPPPKPPTSSPPTRNVPPHTAPTPAASTPQNNTTTNVIVVDGGYYPYYRPWHYGNYSPYGYASAPNGTTPYVLGYDPYSGQGYYSYGSGYSPYDYGNTSYYPSLTYGIPSAVYVDPGLLYGMGPIQQMMGVNQWPSPQQNAAAIANTHPNGAVQGNGSNNANPGVDNGHRPVANETKPPAAAARKPVVGSKAMELAWKFISFGDAQFADLKYSDALERYRRAARECPTLGDAWFREGFAFAAIGKYDQAAKAMRRGISEKSDWPGSNFRLDEIYGDNAADKLTRINGMVKAAEDEPTDGDLAFVLGVHLYCDGKPIQAAPFFRRAAQIQGSDAGVKPFLDNVRH